MSLKHCSCVFSDQVYCWWPVTWHEMKPGLFQKHYAIYDDKDRTLTF